MELWQGPYGNMDAGPSRSLEPRAQLGTDLAHSMIVTLMQSSQGRPQSFSREGQSNRGFATLPTSTRDSRPILHPPTSPLDRRPAQSAPWHPSRIEAQTTPQIRPPGALDTRFSTLSQHSTPENSQKASSRTGMNLIFFGPTWSLIVSTVDPSRRTSFPAPTSAPSSSSFTWRPGDDEEENVIRFQEPVVHDPTIVSDQQDGQVEIKWDTERKRRQGYFSQAEEGSEKSNFRLYNQSEIDFGS